MWSKLDGLISAPGRYITDNKMNIHILIPRSGILITSVLYLFLAGGFVGCIDFDDYGWEEYHTHASKRMTKNETPPDPWITYPIAVEIASNSTVLAKMGEAWDLMIASCSTSGRREYGFRIYYNTFNGTYSFSNMIAGPVTDYTGNASINLSGSWFNGEDEWVATAHVHTSLYYAPDSVYRETGPSSTDLSAAAAIGLPGLLLDYSAAVVNNTTPLDALHHIYTYGPSFRTGAPTPVGQ